MNRYLFRWESIQNSQQGAYKKSTISEVNCAHLARIGKSQDEFFYLYFELNLSYSKNMLIFNFIDQVFNKN
ncbi:hypothetical protein SAMN04489761_0573 [Tenacibaculum sp. MAR_2009_124]|nr:hypothetical protein SAMN04489761_0573 [Tenacibaculum sp. MAR_2009_124]